MDNTTDDVKGAELLPCPFCGTAILFRNTVSNTNGNLHYIMCGKCNARGPWSRDNDSEKWNTRVQLASLKASPAGDGILEEIEKLYRSWNPLEPGVVANWLIDNYDRLRLALSREGGSEGHPIESPELIHDFNSGSGKEAT